MNGRSFACFSRIRVASTSAWASASSGRLLQAGGDQVVERAVVGDQADHRLGRLDRGDHDPGVEPDPADQLGRGDLQLADGRLDVPAAGGRARPGCGGGRPPGPRRSGRRRRSGRPGPRRWRRPRGRSPASRRPAGGRSTPRRPPSRASLVAAWTPGLPGGDDLPGGQRLEDRVGDPQDRRQARHLRRAARRDRPGDARPGRGRRPQEQRALADRLDLPLDDLDLAVVADPVRAEVEAGQPEDAGLLQLGQRLADPLPGDGDVQVARPGQPQGARPGRSAGSTWPGTSGPAERLAAVGRARRGRGAGSGRGSAGGPAPARDRRRRSPPAIGRPTADGATRGRPRRRRSPVPLAMRRPIGATLLVRPSIRRPAPPGRSRPVKSHRPIAAADFDRARRRRRGQAADDPHDRQGFAAAAAGCRFRRLDGLAVDERGGVRLDDRPRRP